MAREGVVHSLSAGWAFGSGVFPAVFVDFWEKGVSTVTPLCQHLNQIDNFLQGGGTWAEHGFVPAGAGAFKEGQLRG
jgi:hypothetical protein